MIEVTSTNINNSDISNFVNEDFSDIPSVESRDLNQLYSNLYI